MDGRQLDRIDGVVADAIAQAKLPGGVVLVARHGKVVFQRAFGFRSLVPQKEAMTTDTVFDLASITKPVATATSIMILLERGKLRLHDRVAEHLPEFGQSGKDAITVFQLLTHQGGLVADNPLADYEHGRQTAWERICQLKPVASAGTRFIYSDVGFIVLGELVRRLSGVDIDVFARENIFGPLGMSETAYRPCDALRQRTAITQRRGDRWIRGEVHDPRAFLLGGVAGHAGLFSTADDLAVFAQMFLNRGRYHDASVLSPQSVAQMTAAYTVPSGLRGLGWDKRSSYSINRGDLLSERAFGHGGFTGTVLWVDPELDLFVIFLSNRLHPDGKGEVNRLAGRIINVVAASVRNHGAEPRAGSARAVGDVLTGIDVLERDRYPRLAGRRVGLITNHTGQTRSGRSTISVLHRAPDVKLVAIFSPEHGLEGKQDALVADSRDPETGLPVFSLYGKSRRPSEETLAGIDVLVFDIQDIGARFYTYVSTLGHAMQAAAKSNVEVMVLDRPNPISGTAVEGPVLDCGRESFVGFHTVCVRHGMTIGELARMANDERRIGARLSVVPIEGWRREQFFDETGLVWVNPSPNIRNLTQAILYPGVGLLETTNLSVGRGTDTPFEMIGAPWLDERRLARALNLAGLEGIRFIPVRFTPTTSKYAGIECRGVNLHVTNRNGLRPVRIGLEIARALRLLHPEQWDVTCLDRLLCDRQVYEALLAARPIVEIERLYEAERQEFERRRHKFFLYE
jgi:uncharacterized protein YbbC (DUF1343 family)/CubicO group peptidase (beta-lactamase class C family)